MDSPVRTLQGLLGSITAEQARKLLDDSGGSIETAVAIYFSNGPGLGPAALQSTSTEEELSAITGLPVGSRAVKRLLRSAHGSLQQAVDKYLADPDAYNEPEGQEEPVTIIGTAWLTLTSCSFLGYGLPTRLRIGNKQLLLNRTSLEARSPRGKRDTSMQLCCWMICSCLATLNTRVHAELHSAKQTKRCCCYTLCMTEQLDHAHFTCVHLPLRCRPFA